MATTEVKDWTLVTDRTEAAMRTAVRFMQSLGWHASNIGHIRLTVGALTYYSMAMTMYRKRVVEASRATTTAAAPPKAEAAQQALW